MAERKKTVKKTKKTILNAKQEKFCLEFRKKFGDAKAAAIAAGYSAKSAASQASQLLNNPKIAARIKELANDCKRKTVADTVERQEELTKILRSEKAEDRDKIRAADILNKMDGNYLIKVEIGVSKRLGDILAKRRKQL